MSKYKYFKDSEVEGLVADLCFKLDRAREFYGSPIIITSGYRSPEHNKKIGGAAKSAHIFGMAVDIRIPQDEFIQKKLAWALGSAGFRRLEICPKHFHVDVMNDESHPNPYVWQGDDFK